MSTQNVMVLKYGEDRRQKMSLTKLYFYYVTDSGYEFPLAKIPMNRLTTRKVDTAIYREYESHYAYEDNTAFILKMFMSQSQLGKIKEYYEVFLDINPKAEAIRMCGPKGFGLFEGRATIHKATKYTKEQLVDIFNFEIIAPPLNDGQPINLKPIFHRKVMF